MSNQAFREKKDLNIQKASWTAIISGREKTSVPDELKTDETKDLAWRSFSNRKKNLEGISPSSNHLARLLILEPSNC